MTQDEKYPLALPQGTVLAGQYVIEKALGQGGFGITYKARDHKTGQSVAVKEFFPDSLASRTTQTTVTAFPGERGDSFVYGKVCFLQEAETLAEFIGNEHIVRVFSYFEENGTAYFVMEFIEGTSFDRYIKEQGGKVSYEEAEKILLPVIDALAVVHAKGIVHRDVTPDNIYITKDGTVKLLDFGAARYSLGDKSRSLDVVLKHGFAPKEQYTRHGRQGAFTDVYTVGASFYFAITGRRPPDSIDRMDEDELIPPSRLGVRIAPEKENAILKAMSVQPANRYQTMVDFREALMRAPGAGVQNSGIQAMQNTGMQAAAMPLQGAAAAQGVQPQPVQQRVFTAAQPQPVPAPQIPQSAPQPVPEPVPQPVYIQQQPNVQPQPAPVQQIAQPANTAQPVLQQKRVVILAAIGILAGVVMQLLAITDSIMYDSAKMIFLLGIVLMLAGSVIAALYSGKKNPADKAKERSHRISKVLLCESLAAAFSCSVYWQSSLDNGTGYIYGGHKTIARYYYDAAEMCYPIFVISLIIAGISLIAVIATRKRYPSGRTAMRTEETTPIEAKPENAISFPREITWENCDYECYSDGTAVLKKARILAGAVTIPVTVAYQFRVTSIGRDAFCNCSSLTSIAIPDSVTSIGYRAFYKCSSLTSIELPDGVTRIPDYAFYNCSSLTSIEIPDGVTFIGDYAFKDCSSLTTVIYGGRQMSLEEFLGLF